MEFLHAARDRGEEGIVLRHPNGVYQPGRPNSGGPCLKHKFVERATVEVLEHKQDKRSVLVGVSDPDDTTVIIPMGYVSIPANHAVPPCGYMVEVEYLYAYPDGGALFQPQYKGVRDDKDNPDLYNTLKFKE